jgi:hypothetical protein
MYGISELHLANSRRTGSSSVENPVTSSLPDYKLLAIDLANIHSGTIGERELEFVFFGSA